MVACVEEVRKIWIWLFRNVRGEGFEGSSVVRMARGRICFRLLFGRQEAVRARHKAVTANLNSRHLMYRLSPATKAVRGLFDQSAWGIVGKSQGVLLCTALWRGN